MTDALNGQIKITYFADEEGVLVSVQAPDDIEGPYGLDILATTAAHIVRSMAAAIPGDRQEALAKMALEVAHRAAAMTAAEGNP